MWSVDWRFCSPEQQVNHHYHIFFLLEVVIAFLASVTVWIFLLTVTRMLDEIPSVDSVNLSSRNMPEINCTSHWQGPFTGSLAPLSYMLHLSFSKAPIICFSMSICLCLLEIVQTQNAPFFLKFLHTIRHINLELMRQSHYPTARNDLLLNSQHVPVLRKFTYLGYV